MFTCLPSYFVLTDVVRVGNSRCAGEEGNFFVGFVRRDDIYFHGREVEREVEEAITTGVS